jgi:chaperone modulatory protein CbpM
VIADWVFDASSVHWLQKAVRLQHDLDIDWVAVAMVIDLLKKNEALQRQNECFQQQLKRFLD